MTATIGEDVLIERLRALIDARRPVLIERGVREVSLVGSRARGAAGPESDVDLLLDLEPDATLGLFDLVALEDDLREALSVEVDIAFKSRLRPYVAERMTRDTVRLL